MADYDVQYEPTSRYGGDVPEAIVQPVTVSSVQTVGVDSDVQSKWWRRIRWSAIRSRNDDTSSTEDVASEPLL
jgi:hypothetical protein